jgi:gluconolactonase
MWQPATAYPDPAIEILDPRFNRYVQRLAAVERLYTGTRWAEGPVWFGDGRYLLWSDIPNNRILKWEEETGQVSIFRKPSNFANGHTRDLQGRLVACEHGDRRITRTEYDGSVTVLADSYGGTRLNSPNDIIVKSDGSVWFTDPPFGIMSDYEGRRAEQELGSFVYRLGADGALSAVITDIDRPNGLAFSPDERKLYVVQSGQTRRCIFEYDMLADGLAVGKAHLFTEAGEGTPDGFRVDEDGNLWCGWGMSEGLNGVRIFAPDGTAIGHIHLPERCANLTFGGLRKNRLFMAASQSLYALYVNARGVT